MQEPNLFESLKTQLEELETLESIFANPKELILTDKDIKSKITEFICGRTEYVPPYLDLTINISCLGCDVHFSANLPTLYPSEKCDAFVRCDKLSRSEETILNSDLQRFIQEELDDNVPCIYSVVLWLQENFDKYLAKNTNHVVKTLCAKADNYSRIWIYSHHIYSKRKREEISKNSKEFKLNGFCLAGKPGIICIEGYEDDCLDFWKIVKSWTWKKIVIRKTEKFLKDNWLTEKKFQGFNELHLNMSDFSKFMEKYGLTLTFQELLGLNDAE